MFENSRVCILLDSAVDNNKPFHCLLYDVICLVLPCATLEQMFMFFKEVYQIRDVKKGVSKEEIRRRLPKHLVVSNVIDHLAQKNLLKRILEGDARTTSRAVKDMLGAMRRINIEVVDWGLEVTFIGPPGF